MSCAVAARPSRVIYPAGTGTRVCLLMDMSTDRRASGAGERPAAGYLWASSVRWRTQPDINGIRVSWRPGLPVPGGHQDTRKSYEKRS